MKKQYIIRLIYSFIFILFANLIQAQSPQEVWVLNTNENGNKEYIARDAIYMKPGFSYKSTDGTTFSAKINSLLLFPPSDNTYLTEDGTITTDPLKGAIVNDFRGDFGVSENGAAMYNIPIQCPEGMGKMSPNISLTYNSMSGEGIAGFGWNLSGLSAISIAPTDKYHDSSIYSIKWNNWHGLYTLDGERICIKNGMVKDSMEYVLESQPTVRIVAYNIKEWGPETFKVYLLDGSILEYGNKEDQNTYAIIGYNENNSPKTLSWYLYKKTDRNGNCINYYYSGGDTNIGIFPKVDKITYGSMARGYFEQIGRIDFQYCKVLASSKYIDGHSINYTWQLQLITVKDQNSNILEKYKLEYNNQIEGKSLLNSVKRSNSQGESLLPIRFEWASPQYTAYSPTNSTFNDAPWKNEKAAKTGFVLNCAGDIDGDGLTDIIVIYTTGYDTKKEDRKYYWTLAKNKGNNTFDCGPAELYIPRNKSISLICADTDEDGIDEFYIVKPKIKNEQDYIMEFTAYKYDPDKKHMVENSSKSFENGSANRTYVKEMKDLSIIVGNFTGSKSFEFIVVGKRNKVVGCSWGYIFNDGHFGGEGKDEDPYPRIYLTDINGNGKNEVMIINRQDAYFYEWDDLSKKFKKLSDTAFQGINYKNITYLGDFNGDGCTDFLTKNNKTPYNWELFLSDGKNTIMTVNRSDPYGNILDYLNKKKTGGSYIYDSQNIIVTDANEDGKSDLYAYYEDGSVKQIRYYISAVNVFEEVITNTQVSENSGFKLNKMFTMGNFLSKDYSDYVINSLGINMNDGGMPTSPRILQLNKGKQYDKITKIKESFGKEIVISYTKSEKTVIGSTKLANESNDNNTNGNTPKHMIKGFIPTGINVVSSVIKKENNRQYQKNSYLYSSPKINLGGRGFIGFAYTENTDNTKGIISSLEKSLRPGLALLSPYKQQTMLLGSNELISENIYYWRYADFKNKSYCRNIGDLTEKDYLNSATVKTIYYYHDDQITLKSVNKDFGGGMTEQEYFTYIKNGSNFFNKVESKTITKKIPNEPDFVRKTKYEYNNKGNLIKEIIDPGDNNMVTNVYTSFDVYGNPKITSTTTNGVARSTSLTYTPSGRFISTKTNNIGETIKYLYDESKGLLLSETDRVGTTTYKYDNWGQLISTKTADGIESVKLLKWAPYNAPNKAVFYEYAETSGLPLSIKWYDALGREIRSESYGLSNKKILIDTEYNSKNQLYRISDPYFENSSKIWAETYTYDKFNRIATVKNLMGITSYNYGALTTTETSPTGTLKKTLNNAGQVVSLITNEKEIIYKYHASGLLKNVTPNGGKTVAMEYDLQGNRIKIIDPDAGTITNKYNGWGQLISEKQAIHKNSTETETIYSYDSLSGLIKTINLNGEKTVYDYDDEYRVKKISIEGKNSQEFVYDYLDRIIKTTEKISSDKIFTLETSYDSFGRINKQTYPSGYYIQNQYDKNGYLVEVKDKNSNSIWKVLDGNAKGQITKTVQGNFENYFGFDSRGLPESTFTKEVFDMTYSFDQKGHLQNRRDNITNQQESFLYDAMNRLSSWSIINNGTAVASINMDYDPNTGVIKNKSDIGYEMNYGENGTSPYRMTSISGKPDNISGENQLITYTDFKKVSTIKEGSKTLDYLYGVDNQRRKTTYKNGSATKIRYYSNNYEEEIDNGRIRRIHYINGSNGLAAIYIEENDNNVLYYAFSDYLGSLTALALPNGTVKERYAYDPWGNRRNPANWNLRDTRTSFIIPRGYTMHEHLDAFALIDMNGRVYDPLVAMFLSPDPYVQNPDNWLNFNRYGYAYNNPFQYTDPSGEFWQFIVAAVVVGTFNVVTNWDNIDNFGQGLAYFGVGAASGALFMTGPLGVVGGGALMGFGNSTLTQGFSNGFNNIDWGQTGISATTGGITAFASYGVFSALSGPVSGIFSSVSSPVLNQALSMGTTSAATGFVMGTGMSYANGEDFGTSLQIGGKGALFGFGTGFVLGAFNGYQYARQNKVNASNANSNTRSVETETIQFGNNSNQTYHTFRHIDELGLNRSMVEKAVRNDYLMNSSNISSGTPINRIIEVGGIKLQYTAFKLPNGTVNIIGRIHGVK